MVIETNETLFFYIFRRFDSIPFYCINIHIKEKYLHYTIQIQNDFRIKTIML